MSDDEEPAEPTPDATATADDVDTRLDPTEFLPVKRALAKVMGEIQFIRKSSQYEQGQTRYNFRGVDAVVNAVGPRLRQYGVLVMPQALEHKAEAVLSSGGKPMNNVTVKMGYELHSLLDDDVMLLGSAYGEGFDSGDKATTKAESVAYRTFWLQALCIPTDDVDPDAESYERGAPEAPTERGTRPARQKRGQRRQQEPPSTTVTEGQAKTLKDAISRINPESERATVLAAFKAEFGISKALEMPRGRYTEAVRWIHEHTPVATDQPGEGSEAPQGDPGAESGDPGDDGAPTFSEVRAWLVEHRDRKFVQTQLAQMGKPATGKTDDLLDALGAELTRRGGIPAEWSTE